MPKNERPTIDDIIARKKPRTRSLWVCIDGDLVSEIERLEAEVSREERVDQREHRRPVAPQIRAKLDKLRERRDEAAVEFTFSAIPKREYRRLIDEHPDPDGKLRWHEDTFAPALIAACAVEPAIPLDRAETICDEWGESEYTQLFHAALMVNAEESQVPFSVRSTEPTPDSESSSTSAAKED